MLCMVRDNLTTSEKAPAPGPMAGPRQDILWITDPAKQKNILKTLSCEKTREQTTPFTPSYSYSPTLALLNEEVWTRPFPGPGPGSSVLLAAFLGTKSSCATVSLSPLMLAKLSSGAETGV